MFEIGATLREARLRRGVDLAEIEEALRIRAKYLRALEEEQFYVLPGAAYARAFLRAYADYLGLDGQLYVDELVSRNALAEEPAHPDVTPLERRPRWQPSRRALVATGAALAVAALALSVAWFDRETGEAPRRVGTERQATTTRAAETKAQADGEAPNGARVRGVRLVVAAVAGNCWLSLRAGSRDGRVLYEGELPRGRSLRFSGKRFWIRFGAPWNVRVTWNGRVAHSLGGTAVSPPGTPVNALVTPRGVRIL